MSDEVWVPHFSPMSDNVWVPLTGGRRCGTELGRGVVEARWGEWKVVGGGGRFLRVTISQVGGSVGGREAGRRLEISRWGRFCLPTKEGGLLVGMWAHRVGGGGPLIGLGVGGLLAEGGGFTGGGGRGRRRKMERVISTANWVFFNRSARIHYGSGGLSLLSSPPPSCCAVLMNLVAQIHSKASSDEVYGGKHGRNYNEIGNIDEALTLFHGLLRTRPLPLLLVSISCWVRLQK
ncbi:hypothetical protein TIFTF001_016208 [Ficus carica]|uniref:Uncharacterized protein n=1 Tax=Ficus carica TaxID=3494 RepID=A0AA88D9N9_FICCA|nr:hypothetical protein TIFTF001_016208 [Ficus carica]